MKTDHPFSENHGDFTIGYLQQERNLPLEITPKRKTDIAAASDSLKRLVDHYLMAAGAILFRGFDVNGVDEFHQFTKSFGHPLLNYEFASTPRTQVAEGIYTSTEYPPHQSIPLHNEQSYTRDWPMKIWFYSALVAESGGATPIADSRKIYQAIAPRIREQFADRGLMYVRNYGNGLDVPWTQVFNTEDRTVVERYCQQHQIQYEWIDDENLRTYQVCQAVARHPVTQEMVWFNQAHLFHISALDPIVRETLLEVVTEENLPRNVYYGDGKPIEDQVLEEIRGVLDEHMVTFPWKQGDVLMLDNMLTAHAREPFQGKRRVVVAMAEAYTT
jgi:alpha-ketoglutarate-dependent taurine dioxygenase